MERIPMGRENFALLIFLVVIIPYSLYHWWTNYAVGADNGYAQFATFIESNLPPQEPLNASGDPVKYHYFFPDRPIFDAETPEEALKAGVHYFAIAPKDFRYRYGSSSSEFAAWIQENGRLIYTVNGNSYGDIFLYFIDFPKQPAEVIQPVNSGDRHWRSFHVAKSGFVGILILSLFVWFLLWGFLILVFYSLHRIRPPDLTYRQQMPKNMKFSPITFIRSWFT